jgi:hypothetical protein
METLVKRLEALDATILSWCTTLSCRVQKLTGKTNFFLAKLGITLCLLAITVSAFNFFSPLLLRKDTTVDLVIDLVLAALLTMQTKRLDEAEKEALAAQRTFRTSRISFFSWDTSLIRLMWLLFATQDAFVIFATLVVRPPAALLLSLSFCFSIGIAIMNYFAAVEPCVHTREREVTP